MIRFALIAASVLGFALTAALGNLMVPLLRELQRTMRGAQPKQETDRRELEEPVPTIGGLCLMVGTLTAVGAGWLLVREAGGFVEPIRPHDGPGVDAGDIVAANAQLFETFSGIIRSRD